MSKATEQVRKRTAYEAKKVSGMCAKCSLTAAASGYVWCSACLVGARCTSASRKAAGLCMGCGKVPPKPERVRCERCLAAASRGQIRFKQRHPEAIRIKRLRAYGLTPEEYSQILQGQDGLCALCRQPPTKTYRNGNHLAVDHDHATGKVRALLCTFCNVGLGAFRDDAELLLKAIEYLRRHGLRSVG